MDGNSKQYLVCRTAQVGTDYCILDMSSPALSRSAGAWLALFTEGGQCRIMAYGKSKGVRLGSRCNPLRRLVASWWVLVLAIAGNVPFLEAQFRGLPPPSSQEVQFERDIAPILSQRCHVCHGPSQQMQGLRLDRGIDALKGGYSGPVIVPGDSAASKLVHLVAGTVEGKTMPPAGEPLTASEIGLLRAWIDQGAEWPSSGGASDGSDAPWPSHWAFRPVKSRTPPEVKDSAWTRNPIDNFVLAKLESESVEPSHEATRETLVRRLSLDLTGLPPTPRDLAEFVRDPREEAYEELVDRLLESPHYAEKWARFWLDLARYADSDGFRGDNFRPHAWRYRHWVIQAFERDMPFDQFTLEQIAGDLLPGRTVDQHVATGFHRNTPTNTEGGSDPEEWRFEQVINRTNTVGTVWLGLTVGCAQCHDHKYDPLTQAEYYRLFAFFNDLEEVDIDAPLPGERGPYLAALSAYQRQRHRLLEEHEVFKRKPPWEEKVLWAAAHPGESADWDVTFDELRTYVNLGERIIRTPAERRSVRHEKALTDFFVREYGRVLPKQEYEDLGYAELSRKLKALDESLPLFGEAQAIHLEERPRQTHIYLGGSYKAPGIPVEPGVPGWLSASAGSADGLTRIDLAKWLVSPENPLTSRVVANRIWQELFGRGLVPTSENFGTQGDEPSHLELLDWLASEFANRGWSWKRLVKAIVMSATYRQASDAREDLAERDPGNSLLARQVRLRLPAELIRDSTLAVSGLLDTRVGGRSVRPPQPDGARRMGSTGDGDWKVSEGPDRYRRGMYIQYQRMAPYPLLTAFDMPDTYESACRRGRTNTPLQALNLLNDPVFLEAAQALAVRAVTEFTGGLGEQLRQVFRLCLARDPEPSELDSLRASWDRQRRILGHTPESVAKLFAIEIPGVSQLDGATWVTLGSAILNLDEFLTRE